ncbi:MAG TPA: transglutaminase family protein [Planctomycetota bacterium]|nr:transglutaminase family protein [Planctomycetota bacterium]
MNLATAKGLSMKSSILRLRVGYELVYQCAQPTPMILMLRIHPSQISSPLVPDPIVTAPYVQIASYRDAFGNVCSRIVAPAGRIAISTDAIVSIKAEPDRVVPAARQYPVQHLPEETLPFLLGSRYCETDRLSQAAWDLFGQTPEGWGRVQAICDYVHRHITFGYEHASSTKSAFEVFQQGKGVCRDYAHLAIAFSRCMNIPARYCTGYLSDVGLPPPYATMDFAGWFEAYLDGQWYTFDPRNNAPRRGRVLMARGRDAADAPLSNTFGPNMLESFKVWTDEVVNTAPPRVAGPTGT